MAMTHCRIYNDSIHNETTTFTDGNSSGFIGGESYETITLLPVLGLMDSILPYHYVHNITVLFKQLAEKLLCRTYNIVTLQRITVSNSDEKKYQIKFIPEKLR